MQVGLAWFLPCARLHVVINGDHTITETHAAEVAPLTDEFLATEGQTLGDIKMSIEFTIRRAAASDVPKVAAMAGELLSEIMTSIGIQVFNFDLAETKKRLTDFISREKYFVFVACEVNDEPAGFIALYESYALYAEGAFGTIPEVYVLPKYRSLELGKRLVSQAKDFGASRGWSRLEVTTPPLPQFDRTLAFYEREGFSITGGRKLKVVL